MKRVSLRTCIGCRAKRDKKRLIRLVWRQGKMVVDFDRRKPGRGTYLCRKGLKINFDCFNRALKNNAFEKAFKKKITSTDFETIRTELSAAKQAANRRRFRPC